MIDTFDPRTRRLVEQVHALGAPALAHLLAAVDRGDSVTLTLERFARLPAGFIRECGGDRFPPRLVAVDGLDPQERNRFAFGASPRLRSIEGGRR